jgi:hypothetical protein
LRQQLLGVFPPRLGVVDGTGTDDDQQAIVFALDDTGSVGSALRNGIDVYRFGRELLDENCGWKERANVGDFEVVD